MEDGTEPVMIRDESRHMEGELAAESQLDSRTYTSETVLDDDTHPSSCTCDDDLTYAIRFYMLAYE